MLTRKTVGAVVGGVGLMLSSVLAGGAAGIPAADGPAVSQPAAPWAGHLAAMDQALKVGNVAAAQSAWRDAYGAALGSRRWDGFAETGDAALRLGRASASPTTSPGCASP